MDSPPVETGAFGMAKEGERVARDETFGIAADERRDEDEETCESE